MGWDERAKRVASICKASAPGGLRGSRSLNGREIKAQDTAPSIPPFVLFHTGSGGGTAAHLPACLPSYPYFLISPVLDRRHRYRQSKPAASPVQHYGGNSRFERQIWGKRGDRKVKKGFTCVPHGCCTYQLYNAIHLYNVPRALIVYVDRTPISSCSACS